MSEGVRSKRDIDVAKLALLALIVMLWAVVYALEWVAPDA